MSKHSQGEDYSSDEERQQDTDQDTIDRKYLEDLQEVLKTTAGTNVVCTLLEQLGTFEPAWSEKNARMAQQTALKDFGNEFLDAIAVAGAQVHDDIQRMMRMRRKLDDKIRVSNE